MNNIKIFRALALIFTLAIALQSLKAQEVALKTNILSDAFLNPNLALEVGLNKKWSINLLSELNAWKMNSNKEYKHWIVQPEARYWLCQKFGGHFLGVHAQMGQFNVGGVNRFLDFLSSKGTKEERHEGWFYGVGVSYGYDFIIAKHLNIEAELGFGWAYKKYDIYPCKRCGEKLSNKKKDSFLGPTLLALNLVYLF